MSRDYTSKTVFDLGIAIASTGAYDNNDQTKRSMDERTFVAFFGRNADSVLELWNTFNHLVKKTKLKHLFWTLLYLKLYLSIDVMIVMLRTSKDTFNTWVWKWISAIASKHNDFIRWEMRNRNAPSNVWCRVTIDGTDFQIGEPTPFNKRWKSPKAKGAAIKYEVAISIFSGDIVWIYGPHVGSKNDLTIFRERLKNMLEPEEMAECDAGYKGDAEYLRSRDIYTSKKEKKEKSELRARHETVNRRFKQWGILKQQFRNGKEKHQSVFYSIAVMTQMDIDSGNVLFNCQPKTRKQDTFCLG